MVWGQRKARHLTGITDPKVDCATFQQDKELFFFDIEFFALQIDNTFYFRFIWEIFIQGVFIVSVVVEGLFCVADDNC